MNAEFVWWFLAVVAVGVGVVAVLALAPIPEIPAGRVAPGDAVAPDGDPDEPPRRADPADLAPTAMASAVAAGQSSPVSTTGPKPDVPSSTSDTP